MPSNSRPFTKISNDLLILGIIAPSLAFCLVWSASFCKRHSADSILPALISTQNLTWYYWGQNRLGNLLPAVTSLISDIDLNLELQIWLRALCAGLGPIFFILVLRPKARFITVYCATLAAILLVERDALTYSYWLDSLPYGTSLALLVPPFLLADRFSWRLDLRSAAMAILILFLLIVVLWVNLSAVLLTAPLFLGLAIVERSRAFVVLTALMLLAYRIANAHAAHIGPYEYVVFESSWSKTVEAVDNLAEQIRLLPALVLASGCMFAGWILRHNLPILRTASIVLSAALIAFLVTANLLWVQQGSSLPRYFIYPITAIIATSAILMIDAIDQLLASIQTRNHMLTAASIALLILAGGLIAWPLNLQCRFIGPAPKFEERANEIANLIGETKASFVDGDYWTVWPAVFLANRNSREPVFGVTFRGKGAREAVKSYIASHSHSVILCVDKGLADCISSLEDVLGRPFKGRVREIAKGQLANQRSPWVAADLDYDFRDESAPN